MHSFQSHFYNVILRDSILSENLPTVSMIREPKKMDLCLGGKSSDENYLIACSCALKIISGQKSYFTQQKIIQRKNMVSSKSVGVKLTLRRSSMYAFLYKVLFDVFPYIKQFDGLKSPRHNNLYSFLVKDIFSFQELVPLFPYFEDLGSLQCQIHFTTKSKDEVIVLGSSLQFCFFFGEK